MKKKLLLAIMGIAIIGALAACGSKTNTESADAASADASGDIVYNALDYVTLGDYKGVEVTATKYEADQDDYDEYLNNILESQATYEDSDKTVVEDGDRIDLAYDGVQTESGQEIDSNDSYELVIGSGTFVDDFEDQLIGAKVGEEVTVNVTFPDDYSTESLQGVDATFTCTVNSIKESEQTVPEYTDDFVNTYTDGEYTTTADYDEYIWEQVKKDAEDNTTSSLESALKEVVYANCTTNSLPDGLLDQQFEQYKSNDQTNATNYGYDFDTYISYYYGYSSEDEYDSALEEYLQTYLEQKLIQEAIAATEGWDEVTDEDKESFMSEYAEYYGYDDVDSFLSAYGFDDTAAFIDYVGEDSFNSSVVTLKTWDNLKDAAKVTYITEEEAEAADDADGNSDVEDTDAE